jgi:VWFA-related protein
VKISTTLKQIDVTELDKKGRPVLDLKPDEVEIYENGVKQQVTGFSLVNRVADGGQTAKPPEKKGDPRTPEPPLTLRPEQVRRTIALVVDDLTLSFESAARTRQALKTFVDKQMQEGDLVGIIRTGAGIGALQQFTSNKQQLYAAIDRVKWNASAKARFGSFDPVEPTALERTHDAGDPGVSRSSVEADKEFKRSSENFRSSLFTTGTLGALKYIVANMGELPGRKSVILFSDGLELIPGFNSHPLAPGQMMTPGGVEVLPSSENGYIADRTIEFLRELVAIANSKAVAFYTLDARGLQYTGLTAADSPADPTLPDGGSLNSFQNVVADRNAELSNSQQGLIYLAKETGGLAYYNKNDLPSGVADALKDLSSYYLVAYEPKGESFDPEKHKFNKIDVKVKRDDVKVRHRSGFFVDDPAGKPVKIDVNAPTKIMKALSSPFAVNDIALRLNALFGHSEKKGYYVHSFLFIDPNGLHFDKLANGDMQAVFDLLAISFGDNGVPIDKNNVTATLKLKPAQYELIRKEGFAYSFIFPVKKPGAYQMRVAIMDQATRDVGSANQFVDVPDIKKSGTNVSGIVLQSLPRDAFDKLNAGSITRDTAEAMADPKRDTSLRQFTRGSVLRFGVEVYNWNPKLTGRARIFHDRQLVYETQDAPIPASSLAGIDPVFDGAFQLGTDLQPGDYVLQIVVNDPTANSKRRFITQYVQFEVIDR